MVIMTIQTLIPGVKTLVTVSAKDLAKHDVAISGDVGFAIDNSAVSTVEKASETTAWVFGISEGSANLIITLGDLTLNETVSVIAPSPVELVATSDEIVPQ